VQYLRHISPQYKQQLRPYVSTWVFVMNQELFPEKTLLLLVTDEKSN